MKLVRKNNMAACDQTEIPNSEPIDNHRQRIVMISDKKQEMKSDNNSENNSTVVNGNEPKEACSDNNRNTKSRSRSPIRRVIIKGPLREDPIYSRNRRSRNNRRSYSSESRSRSRDRSRTRSRSRGRSRTRSQSRGRSKCRSRSRDRSRYRSHSLSRSRSRSRSPPRVLAVFGLNVVTTENQLYSLFSKYGHVEKVHLIRDGKTGISRGFGFVYFNESKDAAWAREECRNIKLDNHTLRVDFSITQRAHTPTPGRGYMGRLPHQPRQEHFDYYKRPSSTYEYSEDRSHRDDYDYDRSRSRDRRSSRYHRRSKYSRSRSRSHSPRYRH